MHRCDLCKSPNCQPNAHQKELGQKPNGILMLPTKIKIILASSSVCVYVMFCFWLWPYGYTHTHTHTHSYINGKRWKFSLIITSVREPCIAFSPCRQADRQTVVYLSPLHAAPVSAPCYPPMTCSWNNNKAFCHCSGKANKSPCPTNVSNWAAMLCGQTWIQGQVTAGCQALILCIPCKMCVACAESVMSGGCS